MKIEELICRTDELPDDRAVVILPPGCRVNFDQVKLGVREAATSPEGATVLLIEASALARLAPHPIFGRIV